MSNLTQYNDVGHLYASFAYDAVWAIALALNATVANGTRVEDFTYDNEEIAEQLKTAMENVKFRGVSVSNCICDLLSETRSCVTRLMSHNFYCELANNVTYSLPSGYVLQISKIWILVAYVL